MASTSTLWTGEAGLVAVAVGFIGAALAVAGCDPPARSGGVEAAAEVVPWPKIAFFRVSNRLITPPARSAAS
jgi:hypothetical protein